MIRFFLGLWAGKFLMLINKIKGDERDDRPGLLAYRFTSKILKRLAKPKLTIVVTGTNGKTTTSSLITDLLREEGLKVAYNDWGANTLAGHIRCLLGAVNIFNKPISSYTPISQAALSALEFGIKYFEENIFLISFNFLSLETPEKSSIFENSESSSSL